MGYPRRKTVDSTKPGYYHCISRCVRRAFLCGDDYDHRRQWIQDRLAFLLGAFAVEICAFAILSNHLHLVVKTEPQAAATWSDLEVARRWTTLFPKELKRLKQTASGPAAAHRLEKSYLESLAADTRKIAVWRERLASISWFNKLLKEPIARRANREEGCSGHFWEGRFKCIRLLDPAAVLACMVYVDLNPLRAGMARALRDCSFTSILERLKVLRRPGRPKRKTSRGGRRARPRLSLLATEAMFNLSGREYVSLVGATGGVPIDSRDHRGVLAELGINADAWAATIGRTVTWFGTAVGRARDLVAEAKRRGATRVVNPLKIYVE